MQQWSASACLLRFLKEKVLRVDVFVVVSSNAINHPLIISFFVDLPTGTPPAPTQPASNIHLFVVVLIRRTPAPGGRGHARIVPPGHCKRRRHQRGQRERSERRCADHHPRTRGVDAFKGVGEAAKGGLAAGRPGGEDDGGGTGREHPGLRDGQGESSSRLAVGSGVVLVVVKVSNGLYILAVCYLAPSPWIIFGEMVALRNNVQVFSWGDDVVGPVTCVVSG